MGRGDKFSCKRNLNKRVRSNDKGSDESDEDYVVSDEEEEESEADLEEYRSSLDGGESEEGFNGAEEEELYELEEENVRQRSFGRPKRIEGHRADRKIGGKKSRKMNKVVSDDEEEEEEDRMDYEEDEGEELSWKTKVGKPKAKKEDEDDDYQEGEDDEEEEEDDGNEEEEIYMEMVKSEKVDEGSLHNSENGLVMLGERDDVRYETGEEDDGDYEDEDDDDDEEFTPDEYISLEEEEEEELVVASKKNKTLKSCKTSKRKRTTGGCKRRKKRISVARPRLPKGGKRKRGRKRKERSDDENDDLVDDYAFARKKSKKKPSKGRGRYAVASDSDFVSSGESGYEYTISEEEREQVREASKLLSTTSRAVSSSRQTQVAEDLPPIRKSLVKKGKEKLEVVKMEVIKHVCLICLSEEDRRRLRGTLDCCSHYFCFTCIMEWSKVESRCPLCKQRACLREVVIPVPERDQVYQPTEEELRSYLDPYENVICTECRQGGDDGLMLLCDLCDSSAHTYCVGLGREVPEGNWYCEGCRSVALGSPTSRAHGIPSELRTTNGWYNRPSPPVIPVVSLEASLLTSPRTPFFHGFENILSPRLPNGDVLGSFPSGSGTPTLSRRRSLHRHIQNIINSNRLNSMAGRTDGTSVANSSNGFAAVHIDHGRESESPQPVKTHETSMPLCTIIEERERDNNRSSSISGTELVSSRPDHLRREEAVRNPSNSSSGLWPGLADAGPVACNRQHQLGYLPNTVSVFRVTPEGDRSIEREQLQLTVTTHLKNLSRQIDLGQATFNEIATCSIHTILAACGLEHRSSEVHVVTPPVTCPHGGGIAVEMGSSSMMKGCCSSCFDSFVKDVVKTIMETRQPHWLSLGL
ncbi:PREDICTED: tyrosine-protein kinase BAZ1B [Tarenaya hassleriana]|uniref:tyrosine-protein kinase BAZ1B n=1 Tax=Tarenaya hassleriana TaxID=28532 RepID=UPI00053C6D7B|nr:PREDICTED: tyrosine-protein kinase BAZ1B [Tarenaya hassleriana]XP_010524845.1 PREDICTED: tyrosine-protein kinase BAZ1B [Tarenaya hassleriana]